MATVADELLADLEASDEELEEEVEDGANEEGGDAELEGEQADEDTGMQDEDEDEEEKAAMEALPKGTIPSTGLNATLKPILEQIEKFQNAAAVPVSMGRIEEDPEYTLLTKSNSLSTQIDNEIVQLHKFIRDHYSTRFPELETLVKNPLQYAKTVAIIGNGPMDNVKSLSASADNIVQAPLNTVLDGPTLMVVTVEATTSKGASLSDSELSLIRKACQQSLDLDRAKHILTDYVQSRMNIFAPNLTILIGSLTAAQLLNVAGGLMGLAKTPSSNIAALGSTRETHGAFATNVGPVRHQGYLYNSPIIRGIPSDLKQQAMRIVSAKIVLAARVDYGGNDTGGAIGEQLKQQCLDRLDKLTEPPPNKGPRALPAPDDKPSRKRGGRRVRKAKEAYAMTDLRKAQNRMAFGKEEAEVGYGTGEGTKGLGMIGQQNEGNIRALQVDQRTKAKLSKKNPGWGGATPVGGAASSLRGFGQGPGTGSVLAKHGLRTHGVGSGEAGAAGTQSSISFTPVQGLELVDPKVRAEMGRKRKAEEDRWFKSGTFTQVGGGPSTMPQQNGGGKVDEAGFKVPSLPVKKQKLENGAAK
ncbi:Nop domain-containing protein [Rhizodiscina lignyota]|uniref:Nop domain-containing protein n=1 Tax=Rhizodiscina lignyota TaxID=1504668 RepID=A0A9P4I466_9PEZI|nr:Nop domain-containing protein [Rhizodiscina lignyota]